MEEYLARTPDGVIQAGDIRVTRIEKRSHVVESVGGFQFGRTEGTGKYEADALRVTPQYPRLADGRRGASHYAVRVARTAAGVKAKIRRIRPAEAERLAALDKQIADLEAQILAVRAERKDVVREAWTRAHVVRLAEIESQIGGAY